MRTAVRVSMTPSIIYRVVSTPELLDLVFGFLDQASNATNARVCKKWSDRALDALWRDVELEHLFSVLAPLKKLGGRNQFSKSPPTAASWKRFEVYGHRVRRLRYTAVTGMGLQQSFFDDVARTRLHSTILPNMHTLTWRGPLNVSVMFMHPRVKAFNFLLSPINTAEIELQGYFEDLTIRMPNLINVSIKYKGEISGTEYSDAIIDLVTKLPLLQTVSLPIHQSLNTSKLMEVFSILPNLSVAKINRNVKGIGKSYVPVLAEGAFPVLRELSLVAACFEDISRFLALEFAPKKLTSLHVDSDIRETNTSYERLLVAVADNCQLLESLQLVSDRDRRSLHLRDDEKHKICFNHLKPLLSLPNLKVLEIHGHFPLALKNKDLELLAAGLPSLEALNFDNNPEATMPSGVSLEALLPFARHCPNLTKLALCVDTTDLKLTSLSPTIVPFKRLECLHLVTSSRVHDANSVALYLSRLLPVGCTVFSEPWRVNLTLECQKWRQVEEVLPLFIQARAEEKEKMRIEMEALRVEMEPLRSIFNFQQKNLAFL